MQSERMLAACLDTHRDLLRLERSFHAWLAEMTGFENPPAVAPQAR